MVIKTVLFDLDGVIRQWDPAMIAQAEADAGLRPGSFWPVAFEPELLRRAVTGHISDAEWRTETEARLRKLYPEADAAHAVRLWSEAVGHVDGDVLQIVRMCRRHATVALVTNATSRLSDDLKRLQLTDEFDHVFNTSELGVAKPDEAVFQIVLRETDTLPEQAFFTDDDRNNVTAAARLGIHAHHYDGVASLQKTVQKLSFDDGVSPSAVKRT